MKDRGRMSLYEGGRLITRKIINKKMLIRELDMFSLFSRVKY